MEVSNQIFQPWSVDFTKKETLEETVVLPFYIGINIGAFLASITVGLVAYYYGWHYGFGLAGIGMLLGQLAFMWGLKFQKELVNSLVVTKSQKK